MSKGERVRSLGGKGGLRCDCCGDSQRDRKGARKMVRAYRRNSKRRAIREGRSELDRIHPAPTSE